MFSRLALGRRQVLESCPVACEVSVPVGTPAFFADDWIQRSSVCSRLGQHNDKNLTEPLTAWAWCQPYAGIWAGRPVFSQTHKSTKPWQRRSEEGSRKNVFPQLYMSWLFLHYFFGWSQIPPVRWRVPYKQTPCLVSQRAWWGLNSNQNGQRHLPCW